MQEINIGNSCKIKNNFDLLKNIYKEEISGINCELKFKNSIVSVDPKNIDYFGHDFQQISLDSRESAGKVGSPIDIPSGDSISFFVAQYIAQICEEAISQLNFDLRTAIGDVYLDLSERAVNLRVMSNIIHPDSDGTPTFNLFLRKISIDQLVDH